MKQPLISFWIVLGMRIEATLESARTVIHPVAAATRIHDANAAHIHDADVAQIPMFLRNFLIWEFLCSFTMGGEVGQ